jgi:hypothetical protein
MQLWYGAAYLPVNGANTSVRYRTILSDAGRPVRYVGMIDVVAYLEGNGQAELTALELAFNAALMVPYRDLVLKQDSGAASGTRLVNSTSLSGVRLTDGPNYTNQAGDGEYVIQRVCRFTMEASYLIANAQNAVLSFEESITFMGTCGPETSWRMLVNASPVQQVVFPSTTQRVIQMGRAVGHTKRPTPPGPRWPYPIEKVTRRKIGYGSPKREGPNSLIEWAVTWSYEYESAMPLVAFPNAPPM